MTVPEKIADLVARFDNNLEAYRSGKYNEAALRQEFINPLFISLGWDVCNEQGHAEAYELEAHRYHRLASTLKKLADSYDRDAERIVSRAPFED